MPKLTKTLLLITVLGARVAMAEPISEFCYPFYAGIALGGGSTTWQELVPSANKQNVAMSMSTPVHVEEGGVVGGVFAGYEPVPYFAFEASYLRYPGAKVSFDRYSLFALDDHGETVLNTHTETIALMGKVMMIIPRTTVRVFSSAGAAVVHRWDMVTDHRRVTPTFGLGFNYNFTPHIMSELAGNYTAGYGESELDPCRDYMPFLYSVTLHLAYRF